MPVLLAASLYGCAEGEPRPQLLVYVDTDLPVPAQALADARLSADAAMDTLRVDVLGPDGSPTDVNQFDVGDPASWPLSFAVAGSTGPVRLRLRLFRAEFAAPAIVLGRTLLEPSPQLTVERVAEVAPPTQGDARVLVRLHGDCLARPSNYLEATTCVDGAAAAGAFSDAVVAVDAMPGSAIGTWPSAFEVGCESDADRLCVPGGFALLGDLGFTGVASTNRLDSAPLRPILVSAFRMDRTEMTVGALRAIVKQTGMPPPKAFDAVDAPFCTWVGLDDPTNDDLPANCAAWETAGAACAFVGGRLPTEAEWEYAARGRGRRWLYPWGDLPATCCMVSASRLGPPEVPTDCAASGVEAVASHLPAVLCGQIGDVSRDGLVDLAGSVSEAVADSFLPLSSDCWADAGVAVDPVCVDPDSTAHVGRGGNWNESLLETRLPLRDLFVDRAPTSGFRCAYSVD